VEPGSCAAGRSSAHTRRTGHDG